MSHRDAATPDPVPRAKRTLETRIVGRRGAGWRDFYAWTLCAPWSVVLGLFVGAYVLVNLLFAVIYLLAGDVIVGARPGSFADAFHFSVQTFSTVGYGKMVPQGIGDVLVMIESAVGVLSVAIATGLMFTKFSRPTAGVAWSRPAVIATVDGVPTLMFRLANTRGNQIVEASVRCVALKDEVSAEGGRLRGLHDLRLRRDSTPLFAMSWLVMHRIDADSPLHGMSLEAMREGDVRVVVSFTGIDSVLSQQVHDHHTYFAEDLVVGQRFRDILSREPDGTTRVDLTSLDALEPAPPSPGDAVRKAG